METAPEKMNAVDLAGRERARVVSGNVKVVSKLAVPVTMVSALYRRLW